ncbi:MAG: FISUMP domain-containing protein [Mucilaginibacter sp.]
MKKVFYLLLFSAAFIIGCKKDKQLTAPTLTTVNASNITANGATLGGNISSDGNSPVTKRGICWALTTNPTVADSITSNGTGNGTFSATLSNLSANATYYVRAYAINGVGTAYGNQITFTTAKGAPTVVTTTAGAVDPSSASVQSGGNVTNDGGASVTARGICFSTSPHPTLSSSLTTDGTGTGTFTSTLKPLLSSQTYYYRAYATNSYGTAYGNELTLTTSSTNTVVDADGNVYYTVTIGTQTWMASNLRTTHYQNGDAITNGFTSGNFGTLTVGAYTFANGDATTDATYGKYYNIYAVTDSRNIAPKGWHVATDQDWYTLEFNQGLTKADTSSNPQDIGLRGTIADKLLVGGSSGLNLQLAGYFCPSCGDYSAFGSLGIYLTSTIPPGGTDVYFRAFGAAPGQIYRADNYYGGSVRCVKN